MEHFVRLAFLLLAIFLFESTEEEIISGAQYSLREHCGSSGDCALICRFINCKNHCVVYRHEKFLSVHKEMRLAEKSIRRRRRSIDNVSL